MLLLSIVQIGPRSRSIQRVIPLTLIGKTDDKLAVCAPSPGRAEQLKGRGEGLDRPDPRRFGPLTLIVPLLINVLFEPRASRPKPREPAAVTVP